MATQGQWFEPFLFRAGGHCSFTSLEMPSPNGTFGFYRALEEGSLGLESGGCPQHHNFCLCALGPPLPSHTTDCDDRVASLPSQFPRPGRVSQLF